MRMPQSPLPSYRELVATGQLEADPAQVAAAKALRQVARDLRGWRPGGFGLRSLLGLGNAEAPKGLYIHGPVGSGKTMLMDLFHNRVRFEPRRRYHFHEFMAAAHDRIGDARKSTSGDPIGPAARTFIAEARLLCFDEIHVTNIADAMILGRLFDAMWDAGVVVVATSNVHPTDLYRNGLNRDRFLPFIDRLMDRMTIIELAAHKDFRLAKLAGRQLYFTPSDRAAEIEMRAVFERLTGEARGQPRDIELKGRRIAVPEAAQGVARFEFADLCVKPLGTLDYLAIAEAFHTVMISGIPACRRSSATRPAASST